MFPSTFPTKPNGDPLTWNNALKDAAREGDLNSAQLALKKGADPSATFGMGTSILELATIRNKYKIVELLLDQGAAVNAANGPHKDTPLHVAQNVDIIALLIFYGAEIDAQDREENTPLLKACLHQETEIAVALLKHNADPSKKNEDGISAEEVIENSYNSALKDALEEYKRRDPKARITLSTEDMVMVERDPTQAPKENCTGSSSHS